MARHLLNERRGGIEIERIIFEYSVARCGPAHYRCQLTRGKGRIADESPGHVEEFKVVITLCKGIKAFKSFAGFQTAAEAAVNLGKQSEGWLRSVKWKSQ